MSDTIIGTKTRINGVVTGKDRLVVAGVVEGQIGMDADVIVEQTGRVEATVEGQGVYVSGTVNGKIAGAAKVEIATDGRMIGDVRTGRILISDGAVFKGRVEMDVTEG
jgi:cytoskeletal protein CcmA (bactofilin family)